MFALLGRGQALAQAALGTWKAHAVFSPLFAVSGPEPLSTRLTQGRVDVLVRTAALYARKVAACREGLLTLRHVLLVDEAGCERVDPGALRRIPGAVDLAAALADQPATFDVDATEDDEPARCTSRRGPPCGPRGRCTCTCTSPSSCIT